MKLGIMAVFAIVAGVVSAQNHQDALDGEIRRRRRGGSLTREQRRRLAQ